MHVLCSTTREHIKSTARSIMFVRKDRTAVRVTLSDGSLGLVLPNFSYWTRYLPLSLKKQLNSLSLESAAALVETTAVYNCLLIILFWFCA